MLPTPVRTLPLQVMSVNAGDTLTFANARLAFSPVPIKYAAGLEIAVPAAPVTEPLEIPNPDKPAH